jgi:hypothetical protein
VRLIPGTVQVRREEEVWRDDLRLRLRLCELWRGLWLDWANQLSILKGIR